MFATKIAVVLRDDLAVWQKLNVTAFVMSGLAAQNPEMIGEPYVDATATSSTRSRYSRLSSWRPITETLNVIHRRALERDVRTSAYSAEMRSTEFDAANREVFARFGPEDAHFVGLAPRVDKRVVDKITKGAKMHD